METPAQLAVDHLYLLDWGLAQSALMVWALGALMLSWVMPKYLAAIVMAVKMAVPVCFFILFFQPEWQVGGDDQGYFDEAFYFYELGLDPLRIFAHSHPWYLLNSDPGRAFFFYYLFIGLYFFGGSYYSAVFLNLLISALATVFLAKAVRDIDRRKGFSEGFAVFLALHWSVIAWSSFLILKEPLVTCLMAGVIFGLSGHRNALRFSRLFVAGACLFLLLWVRYYLPPLIVAGVATALFFSLKKQQKWLAFALLPLIMWHGLDELRYFLRLADWGNAIYGTIHFVLQPLPMRVSEPVEFLLIPSILHWGVFPFAIVGVFLMLVQGHRISFVIIAMAGVAVVFYGLVPDLASTRHRAPIDALLAVMQYFGIWYLFIESRLRSNCYPNLLSGRDDR